MVSASRRHLTDRYASGVDRLLWDTEKRLLPDTDAIKAATATAADGKAEALDIGAALVLLQAARLSLDRLEYEVFRAAGAMGMQPEAIAAVLDLPDAAAVRKRERWLRERWDLTVAEAGPRPAAAGTPEAAERAGRHARQAANRAAEARQRRAQFSQARGKAMVANRTAVDRAAAHASEARVLADEAAERVALGLIRAAEALDRSACGYAESAEATDDAADAGEQQHRAEEHRRSAERYRKLAEQYRDLDDRMR